MTPESHGPSVRARFSAAAATYDAHSSIQLEAGRRLLGLLEGLSPRRILEVGCGTGVFTDLLARRFPEAGIHGIDISERMAAEARRRFQGNGRLGFEAADALAFRSQERFDLIASNASLHWIRPLDAGLRNLADHLAPGGVLAFSIMLDGTLRELHAVRLHVAPSKPPLARMPASADVERALEAEGLHVLRASEESLEARASSAAEILSVLHRQGLTGGVYSRGARPLTRGELAALCRQYDALHRGPGGVPATYRIGLFAAKSIC